ncbi:histidine phosphatase family protein [Lactobacillus corticis]|uniref:Phosphoglycerate mutase n=1 Tax=Lactobacillus corticis TaxID=2201249 RepID=A0A916QL37_9LACO|nr:histidine phosphatase family protein [Lactobacillus corticis]GFZ27760.1 phosphoglycerate mutase [Lactobacillus corticis]
MTKLYLMRHGETYFNRYKKIQGWCDSPLTPEGIAQAKQAGNYFKSHAITFDQAYCSTAERASDTLELVTDLPYTRLKGLKECYFGRVEGETERFNPKPPYGDFWVQYGGESEAELIKRITGTVEKIAQAAGPNDKILLVSHGGIMATFFRATFPHEKFQHLTNCCMIEMDYQDGKYSFCRFVDPLTEK